LSTFYKRFGVRYKKLRYKIYLKPQKKEETKEKLAEGLEEMLNRLDKDERIIFIDEATFSSKKRAEFGWARIGMDAVIEKEKLHFPVVACVGAID
jgi:nucleoid DNA-binding protein